MEKLIIVACLVASAFTMNLQSIEDYVNQNPLVEECEVMIVDNILVVACISKPLFCRSQIKQLETQLKTNLSSRYGYDEVLISFDILIFYDMSKLDDSEPNNLKLKQNLLNEIRKRKAN